MRPLKFPALPRAILLWLAVVLGSALLWFLTLRGIPPFPTGFTPFFAFGLAIALVFGVPLSLLVPRVAPSMLAAEGWRLALRRLALFALGGILALISFALFNEIPTTPWEATAQPPEPMVEFLTTLPPDFSFDGVYAWGEAGQLYNYNRSTATLTVHGRREKRHPRRPTRMSSGRASASPVARGRVGLASPRRRPVALSRCCRRRFVAATVPS